MVAFYYRTLRILVCWWLRKEHATSVLTWSAGEILGEIKETQDLILILRLFLYGPLFPHLYTHEKIEFCVLSKVSFRTKTL